MSDNTKIPRSTTDGDKIATEELAGVKMQRVKLVTGAAGTQDDASSSAPVPVKVWATDVPVITQTTAGLDTNAWVTGATLDIKDKTTLTLIVAAASGAHTTHAIDIHVSADGITWLWVTNLPGNTFRVVGLGGMTGIVGARYVRVVVAVLEGGASTVNVTIVAK